MLNPDQQHTEYFKTNSMGNHEQPSTQTVQWYSQLSQKMEDHIENEKTNNFKRDGAINELFGAVTQIKDNHLTHIKDDISDLKTDVAVLKSDGKINRKLLWLILSIAIAGAGFMVEELIKYLVSKL